ncbi:LysR family transcriptional regulator, pca operon transcriptional activator [Paracoccus isoporae]|uniref:LysR family transcriptional regulator, pca operon transcriptional activator n=1 Tax=Paracoccus isoporae TaxID=591205 RepID=A0A1G6TZJ4_9RHOB|nr:pca operon transcription factor PcaQ [Paracoccus isoporae]SDD34481.1 LysR family transcriptional regulator, pca operon transcriptional activator [Paracoccus isoporae]
MDRRIKLRHIEAFVEITRQRSLKRAAERLNLTQPAISRTLAELEQITGTRLLNRGRGGVELTAQGAVLFDFAQTGLGALERGIDGASAGLRQNVPRLRIAALPSVAARLLPEIVAILEEIAPDLLLTIADGSHEHLTGQLRAGVVDLVLGRLGAPETMRGLSFTQLYVEHVAFVVRPGHPILHDPSIHRLAREFSVIFPPPWAAIRLFVERLLIAQGVPLPLRRIETVSGAFGRVHTARSDAIWVISSGVVSNEIADGRLVALPFSAQGTEGPVGLMRRSADRDTAEMRLLARAAEDAVRRLGLG